MIDAIGVDPIKEFKIEVTHKVECTTKSKLGDVLRIHYTVNDKENIFCEEKL